MECDKKIVDINNVIQTTEGRKDLVYVNVDVIEILRCALDDTIIYHFSIIIYYEESFLCIEGL